MGWAGRGCARCSVSTAEPPQAEPSGRIASSFLPILEGPPAFPGKQEGVRITAEWEGTLDEAYEAAVAAWLAEADPERARQLYRDPLFPLACERMRRLRQGTELLDLLFVPVGTQAYAPVLAVLGNPSRCVALLETERSHPFGREVEEALQGEAVFLHVRVDPVDLGDVALKMRAVFDSRGLPPGARVGADVTGGTKVMTAAVAGAGSLFGWRLFYVRGEQERERMGYAHHERIVELDNVLEVFGARRRETAEALLAAGACRAAAREFQALAEESLASLGDRARVRLSRAAAAFREGRVRALRRLAGGTARAAGGSLPREVRESLERATREPVQRAAYLWAAARTRAAEGDRVGARALLGEAAALLELPGPGDKEPLSEALRRFSRAGPVRQHRRALGFLDRLLGRGLAGTLRELP